MENIKTDESIRVSDPLQDMLDRRRGVNALRLGELASIDLGL